MPQISPVIWQARNGQHVPSGLMSHQLTHRLDTNRAWEHPVRDATT